MDIIYAIKDAGIWQVIVCILALALLVYSLMHGGSGGSGNNGGSNTPPSGGAG